MGEVIGILSLKGGVGKTFVSIELATALAFLKKKFY
jgi:cellulose biosynthesis protein BcsQ